MFVYLTTGDVLVPIDNTLSPEFTPKTYVFTSIARITRTPPAESVNVFTRFSLTRQNEHHHSALNAI